MHRPWGWFLTVYASPEQWVKILTVKPGCKLSLQKHQYRHEVWSTNDYGLKAVIGDAEVDLLPNVRYLVRAGVVHRIINPTAHVCDVVEFAYGHPEEDDIVRIEDDWGR